MTQGELFAEPKPKRLGRQAAQVLNHLHTGCSLTPLDALRLFGVGRLAAVVFDLKKQGYPIASDLVEVGKADGTKARVSSYRLTK